jgi:hypothetical protein
MKPRHAAALALGLVVWVVTELACLFAGVALAVWIGETLEIKPALTVGVAAAAMAFTLRFCVHQLLKEHYWVFTDERPC